MIVKIHKIHWPKERSNMGRDINFEIVDTDCFVTKVTHPCARWAKGEAWYRVCSWLTSKGAQVTLDEIGKEI